MRQVVIADAFAVTAMGSNIETLWQGLKNGQSAISKVTRFSTNHCIGDHAALIPDMKPSKTKPLILNLADRLLEKLTQVPKETLLLTASTKAGIEQIEKGDTEKAQDAGPLLLSALPLYISHHLGLNDPGINISSACASGTLAVARGASMIRSGLAESVLICCMDVISRFVFSGFSALHAMSQNPAKPFDRQRDGLTLGEGACALLLMEENRAIMEGKVPQAFIAGWGAANDATHITAPAKDGRGLKKAILNALKSSNLITSDIAAISAHGTGTVYNDLMELKVIKALFGAHHIPVNSIKGAIGHTLGAAGGLEIALGILMLHHGVVPGTYGFLEPESGAEEIVSPDNQLFSGAYLLSMNSGFGGSNAVVILKQRQIQ